LAFVIVVFGNTNRITVDENVVSGTSSTIVLVCDVTAAEWNVLEYTCVG
jgi:hypothetical protein